MNQKIKEHVMRYCQKHSWPASEENLVEVICEGDVVFEGVGVSKRWWTENFKVVKIDGMLIGFTDAKTTGDMSPFERGWEFDPDTICEVERKEVLTVQYFPKGSANKP